jgi:hypothetical protein
VGVGHVVVVGQGQTEIPIRELRRQLCQQRLDLMNGDAASGFTQCRRIDTGRCQHRRRINAKAR